LYAVGLLVISRGTDITVSLRNAGPNAPMLWLMVTFDFEEAIKAAPWLEAGYFTVVGTVLYATLGAMAGFVADLLKLSRDLPH
jgi:hypothetical protein